MKFLDEHGTLIFLGGFIGSLVHPIFLAGPVGIMLVLTGRLLKAAAQGLSAAHKTERRKKKIQLDRTTGILPPKFSNYEEYMRSDWWSGIRNHTIAYVGGKCEFCGLAATQVHHVRYRKKPNWGTEGISDLVAVCHACHEILHGKSNQLDPSKCEFCLALTERNLSVKIDKHGQGTRIRVCKRCKGLSFGDRQLAKSFSDQEFLGWCENWRLTLPVGRPLAASNLLG